MQENLAKEILGDEIFKERVNHMNQIKKSQEEYQIFLSRLINFVNGYISEKKAVVKISITDRLEIAKFRRLIKKIANNLGYKVKSCKKHFVLVENTKFVIEVEKKSISKVDKE
jgi:hypothetical protein